MNSTFTVPENHRIFQVCNNLCCENEVMNKSNFCWVCNKFPQNIKFQKPSKLFEVVLQEELQEEAEIKEEEKKKNPTYLLNKEFLAQGVFQRTWRKIIK